MSLSPRALTTVGAARRFVFRNAADDSHDPDLEDAINEYSDAIRAYTGREWRPFTDGETRRFLYDGSGYLNFPLWNDLRDLTSIVLFSDMPTSSQRTLASSSSSAEGEFRLAPAHPILGTVDAVYLPDTCAPSFSFVTPAFNTGTPVYEVAVAGDWGIADSLEDVPYDVQRACLIAVKDAYVNPEGYERRDLGEFTITEAVEPSELFDTAAGSLPRAARALLSPYRRGGALLVA